MVNHLVKQFNRILIQHHSLSKKIVSNHRIIPIANSNRLFSTDFKDVYSNENLTRCLNDLNGISYHQSTDEAKKKFFEIKETKATKADVKMPFFDIKKTEITKAAVLIPFCFNEDQQPSILFTLRSSNLAVHKNEICFPGGRECKIQDKNDIFRTAAREGKEELGVTDESINILGALKPTPGKQSNSFVFPVLATIHLTKDSKGDKQNIEFHNKNKGEVEEVIIRPLKELIKVENWSFTHWKTNISTPIYRDQIFDDKKIPRVWGLTSYFLFKVLTSLVPEHFKIEYSTLNRYNN